MKKLLLCICGTVLLAGCDDVDITKYPENIQSCYNEIIYAPENCTTSKQSILKYCQCFHSQYDKKVEEVNAKLRQGSAALAFMKAGSLNAVYRAQANAALNKYADELVESCAKETGYTPFKQCKSKKK